jgi:hypothetical protein
MLSSNISIRILCFSNQSQHRFQLIAKKEENGRQHLKGRILTLCQWMENRCSASHIPGHSIEATRGAPYLKESCSTGGADLCPGNQVMLQSVFHPPGSLKAFRKF